MNFVNGPSKASSQFGVDKPWVQKIKQLFPVKINRFTVHDGEIHYRDFSHDPKVDVVFDRAQMVGTNFTNSKKLSKTLIADIDMEARPLRTGEVRCNVQLDPYAPKPTFDMKLELAEVPITKLNDFAKPYGHFTFDEGTLKVATESNSKNGACNGRVEPVFNNM